MNPTKAELCKTQNEHRRCFMDLAPEVQTLITRYPKHRQVLGTNGEWRFIPDTTPPEPGITYRLNPNTPTRKERVTSEVFAQAYDVFYTQTHNSTVVRILIDSRKGKVVSITQESE